MNELNENLREDLGELLFKNELEKLREKVVDNDSIYKEQLDMLVDMLGLVKKLADLNGKMLNTLNDEVEEVKNLTAQEMIFDLLGCVENNIKTMAMPRQLVEESIKEFGVPAKELALKLATNLLFKNYMDM